MKKTILILALATFASVSAQAADMLKAPAYAQPARIVGCDWCGFSIGVDVGYAWTRSRFDTQFTDLHGLVESFDPAGIVAGGHAGYSWQVGNWVPGVEFDMTWANIAKTKTFDIDERFNLAVKTNLDYYGSLRAKVGYAVAPALLVYATGGGGWAHTTATATMDDLSANAPTLHWGWVAGGGVETQLFSRDLLLRAQYLHYDLGKASYNFSGLSTVSVPARQTIDSVTVGLTYKFTPQQ